MYIFDQNYVAEHLTTSACIQIMEDVLKEEREGSVTQYLRTAIPMPNTNILGIMPGYCEKGYFGAKVLSVYHTNGGTGYLPIRWRSFFLEKNMERFWQL